MMSQSQDKMKLDRLLQEYGAGQPEVPGPPTDLRALIRRIPREDVDPCEQDVSEGPAFGESLYEPEIDEPLEPNDAPAVGLLVSSTVPLAPEQNSLDMPPTTHETSAWWRGVVISVCVLLVATGGWFVARSPSQPASKPRLATLPRGPKRAAESSSLARVKVLLREMSTASAVQRVTRAKELLKVPVRSQKMANAFVRALRHEDVFVRQSVRQKLTKTGRDIPALREAIGRGLKSQHLAVRRACASLLARFGAAASHEIPQLQESLFDKDAQVRAVSAHAIGQMGLEAKLSVPLLMQGLADSNDIVVEKVQGAIASLGRVLPSARALALQQFEQSRGVVRHRVAVALRGMGPSLRDELPRLRRLFRNGELEMRRDVLLVLRDWGDAASPALPELKTALTHKDIALQKAAIRTASKFGKAARPLVPLLLRKLGSRTRAVQHLAWFALVALQKEGLAVLPKLEKILSTGPVEARVYAVMIMNSLRQRAFRSLGVLAQASRDENMVVRAASAFAIARVAPDSERAVRLLLALLEDNAPKVRREAAKAFGEMGAVAANAVPSLVKHFDDREPYVRKHAVRSIGVMLRKVPSLAKELRRTMRKSQSYNQRRYLAIVFGNMKKRGQHAIPALVHMMQHDIDPGTRQYATIGLIRIRSQAEKVVPAMRRCLRDPSLRVVRSCIDGLGLFAAKAKAAVPALLSLLTSKGRDVATKSKLAICRIQGALKKPLASLIIASSDIRPSVRRAVLSCWKPQHLRDASLAATLLQRQRIEDDPVSKKRITALLRAVPGPTLRRSP